MYVIYKIYYGNELVYVGKTKQKLQTRLYQHFFKHPNARNLNIQLVNKIEFTECKSEADMNVLEVMLIEFFKPRLNSATKSKDELTIEIPSLKWNLFFNYLLEKWKIEISQKDFDYEQDKQQKIRMARVFWNDQKMKRQTLSNEEYLEWLNNQENTLNYKYAKEFRNYKI